MVSFIIIGKNEESNIERCIKSILSSITPACISSFEIIYVDGNSYDKSILIAEKFDCVRIFKITGVTNTALGRNVGAREANGSVLFFIDADMELNPHFLPTVWSPIFGLKYEFVSGQIIDVCFGVRGKRNMSSRYPGGTFIIQKSLWDRVNGMRTRFNTGEESDFALRLMKIGYYFKRTSDIIVHHYTVPYMHSSRIWKSLTQRKIFYNKAVLYRHHPFNPNIYKLMWRIDKTCILMFATLIISLFSFQFSLLLLTLYSVAVLKRSAKNNQYLAIYKIAMFYLIADALNILFYFTFFPRDLDVSYVSVGRQSDYENDVTYEASI